MIIACEERADLRGNVANFKYWCAAAPVLDWEYWEVHCRDGQGFLLDNALYQVVCPGPGPFRHATCAAFTDSDLRRAVLRLVAAGLGPSGFISRAPHHAKVTTLLQDTSHAPANEGSWA